MTEEIKAIIEKSLPAQVGDVLKATLEQAKIDAEKVKQQESSLKDRDVVIVSLKNAIDSYKAFDNRNSALETREKSVEVAERDLKVKTLEFQLTAEKEKTEFSKSVALGLVRNIEYRKNIFDSETQTGHYDTKGMWIQPSAVSKSFEEKKSAT